jgi:hypothetical protein
MANFVASQLLAYQAKNTPDFNKAEVRELQNPILRQASTYAPFLVANVDQIKESDKRAVYTYYKKKKASTGGTARSYAPTGTNSDSGQVTLSWVTFSETFGVSIQNGYDNVFSTQEQMAHNIAECQRNLRERIGTYIVSQLHSLRTQTAPVTTNAKNMTWNGANFAFENDASQLDLFYENAQSIMKQNKYYNKFDVIVDPILAKRANYDMYQAAGNAQNLAYQFQSYNPNGIMFHSVLGNEVATAYSGGTAIILPEASFAMIPWIPKINRIGDGNYETFNGGFGIIADDTGLPITYAVRGWAQKADASSTGGTVQDIHIDMEFSVDIAFNAAPMSTSGETPIYEFGQLQS